MRVVSYELRFRKYELRVASYEVRVLGTGLRVFKSYEVTGGMWDEFEGGFIDMSYEVRVSMNSSYQKVGVGFGDGVQ